MFIFRLFHRDNPFEQIEARMLAEGQMRIGRDPEADWPVVDPERTLSRIHCRLEIIDGKLWLRDESTNGTFLATGGRVPAETPVELALGETVRLGDLRILIDAPRSEAVGDSTLTVCAPASAAGARAQEEPFQAAPRTGSLLEAFCKGAGLEPSALSSEDPEALMRRVGAMYQQTIAGLSTLMAQRARTKCDDQLERTTISAAANNPFKWAPTRKLAQDLLCGGEPGFLADAEAVKASFLDLESHIASMAEGAGAAAKTVLEALDPEAIDTEAKAAPSLLRSRSAACWDIYSRRHRELAAGGERTNSAPPARFQSGQARVQDQAAR